MKWHPLKSCPIRWVHPANKSIWKPGSVGYVFDRDLGFFSHYSIFGFESCLIFFNDGPLYSFARMLMFLFFLVGSLFGIDSDAL